MSAIFLFLVGFIILLMFSYLSKLNKQKEVFKFNKENLYKWMNLTKKQRFDLSKRESKKYSIERKNLLNKIRNEYRNISKKNN